MSAPPPLPSYISDPQAITRLSFARVAAACTPTLARFPPELRPLARRIVHASGDPSLLDALQASPDFVARAQAALATTSASGPPAPALLDSLQASPDFVARAQTALSPTSASGAPAPALLCDSLMLKAGIAANAPDALCLTHEPETHARAQTQSITRAMAAVDIFVASKPQNAILLFGSAPTALLRMLEHCQQTASSFRPAAVFAFPVGFVAAAESKQALLLAAAALPIPYITLTGLRGGSALAAAAFNALFESPEHAD